MKHTLKIFLVLVAMMVICLAFNPAVKADTTFVSGTISSNTTWTPAGNPYLVIGGTRVDTNVTLTIQPGVVVKFNDGLSLTIDGALDARGTPTDSIVFTRTGWHWCSIKFRDSSIDAACILEYCLIEHGQLVVYCENASPTITHNTIRFNSSPSGGGGAGIFLGGSSSTISYNLITENSASTYWGGQGAGIYIGSYSSGSYSSPLIYGNTIRKNAAVGSYRGYGGGIYINLYYGGFPIITGNVIDSNVAYTSGGGICLAPTSNESWPASIIIGCNTINDNSITYGSYGGGIYAEPNTANLAVFGNTITGNIAPSGVDAGGIYFVNSTTVNMNYNNIYDNSDLINSVFEVYAGTGPTPINAENNWWGTTDPNMIQLLIYDFWDDLSLREIDYTPFSTSFNTPPSDSLIVISPNGGEEWWSDETCIIEWNPFCFTDSVKIEYSTNSGSTWESLTGTTINVGFYAWEVPVVLSPNCRVKVSDAADGDPSDLSDSDFTICPGPTIIVTYPAGGETLIVDSTYNVSWNTLCFDDNVKIEYSTNGGTDWIVIVPDTANIGSIAWTVPNTPSPNCRVKISDALDGDPFDVSDDDFIIYSRGDANGDGTIDLGDIVCLINYLFKNGTAPNPLDAGDANCDGTVDLGDVVYLINYLYKGGPPPGCL